MGARNGSQRVQPLSVLNRPRVSVRHQVVARYKLVVGKRINSATLIADARHSWLDALSSAGALVGLVAVAFGLPWGDPLAGLLVTAFICHVGYEVTKDVVHRLADGVDPEVITTAESAAGSVPGVIHAHARARWTGRTLRVEVEGWVDPELTAKDADTLGRLVADQITRQLPEAGSFTWTTRAAPGPRTSGGPGPHGQRRSVLDGPQVDRGG